MAQSQLEIQLRCSVCDSVLIIHSVNMSDDGCYSFVEPCEKCIAAKQSVQADSLRSDPITREWDTPEEDEAWAGL